MCPRGFLYHNTRYIYLDILKICSESLNKSKNWAAKSNGTIFLTVLLVIDTATIL